MRVCYVTMAFPTPYETFAAGDVRALLRAGVTVTVHSLRPPHPDADTLMQRWDIAPVGVTHNGLASSVRGLLYAFRRPARCAALVAWLTRTMWRTPRFLARAFALVPRCLDILSAIERAQPDVVHLFWGHYPAIVGYLVHRYCPRTTLSMFLGAYDLEWKFGVSAPVARSASVVWTHAGANVPTISGLGVPPDRIEVVHRGIELGRFAEPRASKVPARIVTAGRLHPDKGMAVVIEAFAGVVRRRPDASLVIVGDGPDRPRLETLATMLGIGSRVSFLGRVPHEEVLEQMAAAELFVYMSADWTDRLPNVVKEAVASRCLCVVSRTTGIEELIRDGVDGWVVERGDVAAAIDRACQALDNPARAAAMVDSANERLRADFDIDRSMRRHVDRWREIVGSRADRTVDATNAPFAFRHEQNAHESALGR